MKKKPKKLVLKIKLNPKSYEQQIKDKKLIADIRKAVKPIVREIKHHFKVDGWPIDSDVYQDEVAYKVFGCHLMEYIDALILKGLGNGYFKAYRSKGINGYYEKGKI